VSGLVPAPGFVLALGLALALLAASAPTALAQGGPPRGGPQKGGPQGGGEPDSPEGASPEEELKTLIKKLNGKVAPQRMSAASALRSKGRAAKEAIPALLQRLSDPDQGVRAAVAEALGRVDDGSPKVVAALAAAVTNNKTATRGAAAMGLAEFGEKAQAAVPALVKALPETELASSRRAIVRALGRIGHADPKQKKGLVDLIRAELNATTDREVKLAAAGALPRLGEMDPACVPVLAEAAADARRDIPARHESVSALATLGPIAKAAAKELTAISKEAFVENPVIPYQEEEKKQHEALVEAAKDALAKVNAT